MRRTSTPFVYEEVLTRAVCSHVEFDPAFPQLIVKWLLPLPHLTLPLSRHRPLEVNGHCIELDVANLVLYTVGIDPRHCACNCVDVYDTR